jgi:hypothetical protein
MFDLAQLEIGDSSEYTVTDARGNDVLINGTPFVITVASPGTEKAVNAQFKRDEARSSRMIGAASGLKSKRTAKDNYMERADFLMAVIDGTSHPDITYAGKTGTAALRAMLLAPKLAHIAEGIEQHHQDRGNFSADSPTASPSE